MSNRHQLKWLQRGDRYVLACDIMTNLVSCLLDYEAGKYLPSAPSPLVIYRGSPARLQRLRAFYDETFYSGDLLICNRHWCDGRGCILM